MASLSVVIVTAGPENASLAKCLSSLSAQTLSDFEVIVVCSGVNVPQNLDRAGGQLAGRIVFVATASRYLGIVWKLKDSV